MIEENNVKMCENIDKVKRETSAKSRMSYAETVQMKLVMPNVSKQMPLIIKPKGKQNIEKTRDELNKKVNPTNLKITNVENRRNGTIIIQSESNEERDKIKTAIENEMSENYDIKVPNPAEFYIDIMDISFKYSEEEIIEKMKKQNPIMNNSKIKIVKMFDFKRNNRTIYNIKIKTDSELYEKLIGVQRINIGWERCRVFDGTDVRRCFKCKGYNHLSSECKNMETCIKCHGNHKSQDCNKEPIMKCINCVKMNKKLNMGLDENHATYNKECPVYQNKLKMRKKRMGLAL